MSNLYQFISGGNNNTMVSMHAAGLSDVGRLRTNNEDNYIIKDSLLIVADGMGGAAAGEIASSIGVNTISENLKNIAYTTDDDVMHAVAEAITAADLEIKEKTRTNPDMGGMGTTVVVTLHFDSRVLVGNIGDSRAYLITDMASGSASAAGAGGSVIDANAKTAILEPVDLEKKMKVPGNITRITEDHSVVMELVNSGVIEEEDIRTHPLRNRITRCLGSLRNEGADIVWHDIHDGDVMLMCSDGLWELVHDDIILAVVSSSINMEEVCKRLIDAANDAGGSDNITVIAAQFLNK